MTRPLLLGHRGTPRLHRENTLAGFQEAMDAGLDGVELDVRRCADGTLVVHHDERLFDGRAIPSIPYRAVRPHPVPTLAEVCAWAKTVGAYLNVELKFENGRIDDRAEHTVELLRRYGLTRRVIVSSFSPGMLRAMRAHGPEIERGWLYEPSTFGRLPLPLLALIAARLDVAALHPHHSLVTPRVMALARRRGWRVNTWTVNEPADVRRLADLGVDGLIGDVPDVLLAARS